jgi:hypothetical protein
MGSPCRSIRQPCECCGVVAPTIAYGEADASGHVWTHYTCEQCKRHCSSDEDGNPVHMRAGWNGDEETFWEFRADGRRQ